MITQSPFVGLHYQFPVSTTSTMSTASTTFTTSTMSSKDAWRPSGRWSRTRQEPELPAPVDDLPPKKEKSKGKRGRRYSSCWGFSGARTHTRVSSVIFMPTVVAEQIQEKHSKISDIYTKEVCEVTHIPVKYLKDPVQFRDFCKTRPSDEVKRVPFSDSTYEVGLNKDFMDHFYPWLQKIALSTKGIPDDYSLFSIIEKPSRSILGADYDKLDVECVGCFGHVENGEDSLTAVLRETFEESAINLKTEWCTTRPHGFKHISTDPINTTDYKGRSLIGFVFVVPRNVVVKLDTFKIACKWGTRKEIEIEASGRYNNTRYIKLNEFASE